MKAIAKEVDRADLTVREHLIEVAARHFAEFGYRGTSQRAIQREVGVNMATANYHFGSKEALYRAVVETALAGASERRIKGLESVPPDLPPHRRLRAIMRAYVAPHLWGMDTPTGYWYARILASLHLVVPDPIIDVIEELITPVRDRYVDVLSKMFPNASRNRILEVLRMGAGLMSLGPVGFGHDHMSREQIEGLIEDIAEVASLAFEALCGGETRPSS